MEFAFQIQHLVCIIMFLVVCAALLAGFPVAFTLGGVALLFAFGSSIFGLMDLSLLGAFPQRILAVMDNEVLVAVPLFVFMGVVLERSGIAEELLDTMGRLFGPIRGGLTVSVSVVGALLAASTGIVGATVVTMGLLSLPTMLRRGYDASLACGSICAAGTLGQIIPPSIILILLGDQLGIAYQTAQLKMGNFSPDTVSVPELFAGGVLPGLVLVSLYIIYQLFIAWIRPESSPAIPRESEDGKSISVSQVMHSLLTPILLIVAVLGSILGGLASPTEAASVGCVGAILMAAYRQNEAKGRVFLVASGAFIGLLALTSFFDLRTDLKSISTIDWIAIAVAVILTLVVAYGVIVALVRVIRVRIMHAVVRSTMEISVLVFIILIGARMFSLTFRGLGGDTMVEHGLLSLPGGALGAMFVVMLVMFIMGFFLDFLEIMFIVVPIVAPVLLQMQIAPGLKMDPIWLGLMIALNLQTSFLTPPFGFALFYLRGVAPPEVKTIQIYKGIIPFVLMQVAMLVVLWLFPGLPTWLPHLLYPK
jgi:tripartite ATP-independent transporter DctM subunit